ncbi:threonine--tRNA ligase [Falsibacillus albus]|uniref:threonine--tRNA ligase n=1 Tax=Falsibacillus albus TaxID=2478915 RepID=UPI0038994C75
MFPDGEDKIYHLGKLFDAKEDIGAIRQTALHVLGRAVKRLYPDVKLGKGGVLEDGFYYDFDFGKSISSDELIHIQKEMEFIVSQDLEIHLEYVSKSEAVQLFERLGEDYKLKMLESVSEEAVVWIFKHGAFFDLCPGPELASIKWIQAFKLSHVSGVYDEVMKENQMIQRIYGTAFISDLELKEYLQMKEEAAKRDHRKLGKEMDLFMFSEEAAGMPFYLPDGQIIRQELEAFLRDLQLKNGYEEVRTPSMMNARLWEQSGHWDHYKENMYFAEVDNSSFAIKPMNCPGHMLIYRNKLHSYRDLPIRLSEFGQVHRHEFSGGLNGLLRVRSFCQDDAHIFAAPDQIEEEIMHVIQLIDYAYQIFGFEYKIELSTRPQKSMGEDALWESAEHSLKNVLDKMNCNYRVNEGDGAFYGPKIDFHIKDALNRSHQCATVQLDFQLPEKFDLVYMDANNEKQRPVVIHRAIFGSIDRFFGMLLEHFAGAFPTWLAPVQAVVMPISHKVHGKYAKEIADKLSHAGIRTKLDDRHEKLGLKIRNAQLKKIPYMIVIGDKEVNYQYLSVRKYGENTSSFRWLGDFMNEIRSEIQNKKL